MREKKTFGQILKAKRIAANLSQATVAEHFGYSTPQFISNWERNVSMPPIELLRNIAHLYGVSADEMFELALKQKVEEVVKDMRRRFGGR